MSLFFQFYRQREAERNHHLWWKRWLSSGWSSTVSLCEFLLKKKKNSFISCYFSAFLSLIFRWRQLDLLLFLVLLHRYKNIPQMSFDDTGREPEQAFRLNRDPQAELEYPTKWEHLSIQICFTASVELNLNLCIFIVIVSVFMCRIARFSSVQHLSIHISKNFGAENTRVYYIGLRGEYSQVALKHETLGHHKCINYIAPPFLSVLQTWSDHL